MARWTEGEQASARAEIIRLHALGWTDGEIAQRLQVKRQRVSYHRAALELASHRGGPRHMRANRRATRRWLKSIGYRSLAQLRHDQARAAAARDGWPAGATQREVIVMAALRRGARTVEEVARAVGLTYRTRGSWATDFLRLLASKGWLERGWRRLAVRGRQRVYRLAPKVLMGRRRWEERRSWPHQ